MQAVQGSALKIAAFGPFPWTSAPSAVAETWIRVGLAGIAILLWLHWTRLVTERLRARAVEIETLAAPIGTPDDN